MAITITGQLDDFYQGESVDFSILISIGGVAQDISSDTVTFYLKEFKSGRPLIEKTADVASQGANGIATVELTTANTDLPPKAYFYEVIWKPASGGKKVLVSKKVTILDSITS